MLLTTYTDSQVLYEEKDTASQQQGIAQSSLSKSKKKKDEIPKLEVTLSDIELKIKQASKKLPSQYIMDRVVQDTATIAQDIGVKLQLFDPGDDIVSDTSYKYVTLPIEIGVLGSYGEVAAFYDQLVHSELMVHIKNLDLKVIEDPDETDTILDLSSEAGQQQQRDTAKIEANAQMVIYRSLTQEENDAIKQRIRKRKEKEAKDNKRGRGRGRGRSASPPSGTEGGG